MIEPTDEMERAMIYGGPPRERLAAVLAIVERDHFVSRRPTAEEIAVADDGMVPDCIFCAEVVAEDNRIAVTKTAYLRRDLYPASDGHVEAVPLRHVESFFDLTRAEVSDVIALLRRARDLAPADAYTIGINEGRAAGRTVDHLHVHLIPRRHGDVEDPRGGIRQVLPGAPHPSTWQDSMATGSQSSGGAS